MPRKKQCSPLQRRASGIYGRENYLYPSNGSCGLGYWYGFGGHSIRNSQQQPTIFRDEVAVADGPGAETPSASGPVFYTISVVSR
jgi:hypothetical protein